MLKKVGNILANIPQIFFVPVQDVEGITVGQFIQPHQQIMIFRTQVVDIMAMMCPTNSGDFTGFKTRLAIVFDAVFLIGFW
jgi:hypothetical protein